MDTVHSNNTETRRLQICQRCGGQVLRSHDEIICLQCGAPHTADGKLIMTLTAEEYEAQLAQQKEMVKAENLLEFSSID